jgi:hypothetical protein
MSKEYVKALKRTSPNGAVSYEIEHEGERVRLGFTAAGTLRLYTPSRRLSPKAKVAPSGRWGSSLELVNRDGSSSTSRPSTATSSTAGPAGATPPSLSGPSSLDARLI